MTMTCCLPLPSAGSTGGFPLFVAVLVYECFHLVDTFVYFSLLYACCSFYVSYAFAAKNNVENNELFN